MTQEQALEKLKAIFPGNKNLAVSRDRMVGARNWNQYFAWSWSHGGYIICSSDRSWGHLLAIAKSGNEDVWEKVDEPTEETQ